MKPYIDDYANCLIQVAVAIVAGLVGLHWFAPALCTFFAGFNLCDGLEKHMEFLEAEKRRLRGRG